jgi:peptidoglycan hydrolase-like protein with peptidoglycan-binding domain
VRVWFDKYTVGPGSAGLVSRLVTWDELAHADEYVELGRTSCAPTNVDANGLPVLEEGGRVTAGGVLCPAAPGTLPHLVPGVDDIRDTRVLQIVLQSYGMYAGALDGRFGPSSRRAVRDFQENNGLETDGLVGPKTWGALKASYCRNWN